MKALATDKATESHATILSPPFMIPAPPNKAQSSGPRHNMTYTASLGMVRARGRDMTHCKLCVPANGCVPGQRLTVILKGKVPFIPNCVLQ